jgi:hypothetical protein
MFVSCSDFEGTAAGSAFEQIVREQLYEMIAANEDRTCGELVAFVKELLLFN